MNFYKFLPVAIFLLGMPLHSAARDINLDEIYIKKNSIYNKKLVEQKFDIYQKIDAIFVDRDISFAWWISGDEILYIRENIGFNINIIYRYNIYKRKSEELRRFSGAVTIARVNQNGKYLIIKRLIQKDSYIPEGQLLIFDTESCEMSICDTKYAFLDFSTPEIGNSIIYENKNMIIEYHLDIKKSITLLYKPSYSDIIISKNPSIALLSPDRNRCLVINGSGGYYKCKLIDGSGSFIIDGLSSSSEIYWLDNDRLLFRKGSPGSFSVVTFQIKNRKEKIILSRSFNTNITCSSHARKAAFLKEQLITIFDIQKNRLINTGLEGEDISFSPNGNRFISLIYKKLFIVNAVSLDKKTIELKRSWSEILSVYTVLKNKNSEFANEYSLYYIGRKIAAYSDLINN